MRPCPLEETSSLSLTSEHPLGGFVAHERFTVQPVQISGHCLGEAEFPEAVPTS